MQLIPVQDENAAQHSQNIHSMISPVDVSGMPHGLCPDGHTLTVEHGQKFSRGLGLNVPVINFHQPHSVLHIFPEIPVGVGVGAWVCGCVRACVRVRVRHVAWGRDVPKMVTGSVFYMLSQRTSVGVLGWSCTTCSRSNRQQAM